MPSALPGQKHLRGVSKPVRTAIKWAKNVAPFVAAVGIFLTVAGIVLKALKGATDEINALDWDSFIGPDHPSDDDDDDDTAAPPQQEQ